MKIPTLQEMKDQVMFIETYLPRCTYTGIPDDYEEISKFIRIHLGKALLKQYEEKQNFQIKKRYIKEQDYNPDL